MAKKLTVCEEEFEKWWNGDRKKLFKFEWIYILGVDKKGIQEIWNQSWKICGDKILEGISNYRKENKI